MRYVNNADLPVRVAVAWRGAATGVVLSIAYAVVFALYAVVRLSFPLWAQTPPDIGKVGTLAAAGASIVVASIATAVLLALVVALFGAATALILQWLVAPTRTPNQALLVGAGASVILMLLYQFAWHLVLQSVAGRSLLSLGLETYLFWFGLPGLIYVCAGAVGAWQMTLRCAAKPRRPEKQPNILWKPKAV